MGKGLRRKKEKKYLASFYIENNITLLKEIEEDIIGSYAKSMDYKSNYCVDDNKPPHSKQSQSKFQK